jgi:hypothetical protein
MRYTCCVLNRSVHAIALAAACWLAGCNSAPPLYAPAGNTTPAAARPDASAGSSGVGRVPGDAAVTIDPISLIGTWSFDRTCASEDGITLQPDGTAGTDQGNGMWAVDAQHRLVIIFREQEMGKDADPLAERRVWTMTATKPVGDDFVGRIEPRRTGEPPVALNAKRCPRP